MTDTTTRKVLLLGCGHRKELIFTHPEHANVPREVTTLDHNPDVDPDIQWDMRNPLLNCTLIEENMFDELHAYEVLEHIGRQGDVRQFFIEFYDYWRALKPGGLFFITCPKWDSIWTWGDPDHSRVLSEATFTFLSQKQYEAQEGKTPMSDYRHLWKGDFELIGMDDFSDASRFYVLEAKKDS